MSNDTNRAWRMHDFGLANLHLDEIAIPEPGPGEVLVRVAAVALNYKDTLILDGALLPKLTFPHIPTSDAAGYVVATGDGVTHWHPGDRVMGQVITDWIDGGVPAVMHTRTLGMTLPGTLSRYAVLRADAVVATPPSLSDAEAATLPIAALTAWSALVETSRTAPGQTVLIQGTGGVALFALQFARTLGLRAIVTSSSDAKLARAADLGAWRGINYRTRPDWDTVVRDLTGGHGADHVLEMVGGANVRRSAEAAAADGRITVIGLLGDTEFALSILPFMRKRLTIQGAAVGSRRAFERMATAIETNGLRPVIDSVHPFEEAPRAFDALTRGPFGKVVVDLT